MTILSLQRVCLQVVLYGFTCALLFSCASQSHTSSNRSSQNRSSALSSSDKKANSSPKKLKYSKKMGKVNSLENEHLAKAQKLRRKRAKQMDKPQYSNPMYFGHKKKPKKRPLGKQKLCKECGIRH
ncbi:hypothetical protein AAG747_20175 [Rapidithrix thailandica]|uniref:Secreted protein n=1 Tax=Rapidithrix thailandica TaxID=413964 RepID=A0AAW9S2A5_9BACT